MSDDIYKLLAERETTHGSYEETARISQECKNVSRTSDGWHALDADMKESLDSQDEKKARILSGDPNCIDHWRDIAGRAMLIVRRLESKSTSRPSVASPSRVVLETVASQRQFACRLPNGGYG